MTPPAAAISLSWSAALAARSTLDGALAVWLPTRRWFAAKDLTVEHATAEGLVELADDVALVVVRVELSHGAADQRYAAPLALVAASTAPPDAVLATAADGVIVDAMTVEDPARVVIAAALRSAHLTGRGATAIGTPRRSGLDDVLDTSTDVHLLTAEE